MNTTKVKKFLDLAILTQEKEPELLSLEECLQEAGGFPFSVKAIGPGDRVNSWPVGIELTFHGSLTKHGYIPDKRNPNTLWPMAPSHAVTSNFKRWMLLGHK